MSYTDGKIYKLVSKQTDKIYIGSTKCELNVRFNYHKSATNTSSSRKILTYADCEIVLIENYPCNSRTELELREGELQLQSIDVIVNKYIAGRTSEKYRLDNQERYAKQNAQYYADNKEKYAKQHALYRLNNKDKIAKQRAQRYLNKKLSIKVE